MINDKSKIIFYHDTLPISVIYNENSRKSYPFINKWLTIFAIICGVFSVVKLFNNFVNSLGLKNKVFT